MQKQDIQRMTLFTVELFANINHFTFYINHHQSS